MSATATIRSIADLVRETGKTKQVIAYELVEEVRKNQPGRGVAPIAAEIAPTFSDWTASAIAQGHQAQSKVLRERNGNATPRVGRPRSTTTRQAEPPIEVIPTDEFSSDLDHQLDKLAEGLKGLADEVKSVRRAIGTYVKGAKAREDDVTQRATDLEARTARVHEAQASLEAAVSALR